MKSLICLSVIFALCLCHSILADDKETVRNYWKLCYTEHSVTTEELNALNSGNVDTASENIKCAADCFYKKLGIYDENGEINESTAKQYYASSANPEKLEEAIRKCRASKGNDTCDTAWEILKCVKKDLKGKKSE